MLGLLIWLVMGGDEGRPTWGDSSGRRNREASSMNDKFYGEEGMHDDLEGWKRGNVGYSGWHGLQNMELDLVGYRR